MTENEAKVEANEQLAYEYLTEMTPEGWTVTRTTDKFDRYDVTVSNGDFSFIAENKIRDYSIDKWGEYAIIDASKVEYLLNKDINARIISYYPINNAIFSHHVKDAYKWEKKYIKCRKNSFSKEKVWKWVYFLPTTEEYRVKFEINITNGLERLEKMIKDLCK